MTGLTNSICTTCGGTGVSPCFPLYDEPEFEPCPDCQTGRRLAKLPALHLARPGELAFWDTITAGLVPCKVLGVWKSPTLGKRLLFRITANRGPFHRGEQLTTGPSRVVPRFCVHGTASRTAFPRFYPVWRWLTTQQIADRRVAETRGWIPPSPNTQEATK